MELQIHRVKQLFILDENKIRQKKAKIGLLNGRQTIGQ